MTDCNGDKISVGMSISYQFDTAFVSKGTIVMRNRRRAIRWDDNGEVDSYEALAFISDFWHEPTDSKLTKIVKATP